MSVFPLADECRHASKAPRMSDEMIHLIGLIIIHWGQLESDLGDVVTEAADVTHAVARLAFRGTRAAEQMTLIKRLLETRNIDPPDTLAGLQIALKDAEEDRNKVAHGTWVRWPIRGTKDHRGISKEFENRLRVTTGAWEKGQQERFGMKGRVPKKVIAHADAFTIEDATALLRKILALELQIRDLHSAVRMLRPPPPERPSQSPNT